MLAGSLDNMTAVLVSFHHPQVSPCSSLEEEEEARDCVQFGPQQLDEEDRKGKHVGRLTKEEEPEDGITIPIDDVVKG